MARRYGGARARFISSGRKTFWLGGIFSQSQRVGSLSASVMTTLNAGALALRPFTIVRTRGYIHITSDQVAASEDYSGVYAHSVVSVVAAGVGATAVPTPVTNSDGTFHVYEPFASDFQIQSAVGFEDASGLHIPFDSRAMRKVEEGEDLISVVESSTVSTGFLITAFARTLIKLH